MASPNMESMKLIDIIDDFTKIKYKMQVSESMADKIKQGKQI